MLENKVVIITGAGGGIGSALAKKFTDEGAKVALIDVKEEFAKRTFDKLGLTAEQAICLSGNISDEAAVKDVVAKVKVHFGTIDVLINTAGIQKPTNKTEEYSFENFKMEYQVNVFGTFLMMQNVLPIMKAQKKGVIVNFASVSGIQCYPEEIGYGSSKAAVVAMTKNVAAENGKTGVRVNAIAPGWVDTPMMQSTLASYEGEDIKFDLGPMDRPATPSEMANCVAFLCSDDASYINGSIFIADGGMMIGR